MTDGIFVVSWNEFLEKVRRFNSGNKVCWTKGNGEELKAILVSGLRWGYKTTTSVEDKKQRLKELGFVIAEKVPSFKF